MNSKTSTTKEQAATSSTSEKKTSGSKKLIIRHTRTSLLRYQKVNSLEALRAEPKKASKAFTKKAAEFGKLMSFESINAQQLAETQEASKTEIEKPVSFDFNKSSMKEWRTVKSPSALDRRSISPWTKLDLRSYLKNWIKLKNYPRYYYRNLLHFGHNVLLDIDKENINTMNIDNRKKLVASTKLSTQLMFELYMLLEKKYPLDQCEAWLKLVTKYFKTEIENNSMFWEFQSALSEARKNFFGASELLKKAVAEGAKSNDDENVEMVRKQFTTLSISGKKDKSASTSNIHE